MESFESAARPTLILHDIRSTYNVGSILRTADAIGGANVVCCGITPHPRVTGDPRSPVVIDSNTRAIAKTALGAEQSMPIAYEAEVVEAIAKARDEGRTVLALEQHATATDLFAYEPDGSASYAIVLGGEVDGIASNIVQQVDAVLEIAQFGAKESLNVSVAAGIALFQLFGRMQHPQRAAKK